MEYNEYIAPAGKVLFNIDTFTYGNIILSSYDLNLLVLDESEAEILSQEYREKEKEVIEAEISKQREKAENNFSNNVSTMSLNEDEVYNISDEEDTNPLDEYRKAKLAELIINGVSLSLNNIICNRKLT